MTTDVGDTKAPPSVGRSIKLPPPELDGGRHPEEPRRPPVPAVEVKVEKLKRRRPCVVRRTDVFIGWAVEAGGTHGVENGVLIEKTWV